VLDGSQMTQGQGGPIHSATFGKQTASSRLDTRTNAGSLQRERIVTEKLDMRILFFVPLRKSVQSSRRKLEFL